MATNALPDVLPDIRDEQASDRIDRDRIDIAHLERIALDLGVLEQVVDLAPPARYVKRGVESPVVAHLWPEPALVEEADIRIEIGGVAHVLAGNAPSRQLLAAEHIAGAKLYAAAGLIEAKGVADKRGADL